MRSGNERGAVGALLIYLALSFSVIFIAAALAGCGGSIKQKTLKTAMVTLDAVKGGLEVYDEEYQLQLIEKAESREDLLLAVQRYRARRAPLLDALIVVYKAIAIAALNPSDINVGEVLKLIEELREAIERFKNTKDELKSPDEDDEPSISRRTVLVQGDNPCRRCFGMPSSYCRLGRTCGASFRASATNRFLTTPRSRPASQRWL